MLRHKSSAIRVLSSVPLSRQQLRRCFERSRDPVVNVLDEDCLTCAVHFSMSRVREARVCVCVKERVIDYYNIKILRTS